MTPSPRRRWLPLLATLALVLGSVPALVAVLPAGTAQAQAAAVGPWAGSVTAPHDYFTSRWHDPVDFNNPEDFNTTPRQLAVQGSASLADGRLNLSGAHQVYFLRSDPGSYPTSAIRDPRARPLDANRFRRLQFRMYSDRETQAGFFFRQCNSCADGIKYFLIRKGWHSYDLDMTGPWDFDGLPANPTPVRGAPWAGFVEMLWLITNFDAGNLPNLQMDSFAIIEPSPDLPLTLNAGSGQVDLWMDLDNNQGNDGTGNVAGETASYVGRVNATGTVGLPSGLLRRGETARFYTVRNGVRAASSSPVTMAATSRPQPRVLTPWEGGGEDWAWTVRRDAWDFNEPSDAEIVANAGHTTAWGQLLAWGGGRLNDPVVLFNRSGHLIDGQLFHKAAITINYDGPWGLEDAPGGGMVGRIVWHPAGGGPVQVSDDLVLRTGRHTYYVELRPWPPQSILDPAGNAAFIGWGVGSATWIKGFEFHPHEDPGGRSWQLDDVRLLRNEFVDNAAGGYDIRFLDDAWAPGTTATIVADPDRDTGNGGYVVLANGLPVGPGINTYRWNGWPANPGSYVIRVILHRGGVSADSDSSGQVDYGPSPAPWPPPVVK